MDPLQLAQAYMEIFYSGEALHRLHGLLAEDFSFQGSLARFDCAPFGQ